MAFDAVKFGAGLLQLVLGIVFALVAVYMGIRVFDRFTKGVDEIQELKRGNVAVGILLASVVFAIATVVRTGVDGVTTAFFGLPAGATVTDYALAVAAALVQLTIALVLATAAIRMALWVFDAITPTIDEEQEIRNGNVAVAIVLAGVIVSVASVIASGVSDLSASVTF